MARTLCESTLPLLSNNQCFIVDFQHITSVAQMHLVYLKPAFVFYAAQTVAASGSGNVTADADGFAPPWVGNPQGRGTLTIVIKCVTTLLLAAWVPLHLNIPSFEQSIGARCRGFGFWATFTFLIPEWVVYIAFEQWRQMRKFLGEMKRARKELHEKQNSGISDVVRLLLQEVSLELPNTILLH